MYGVMDAVKKNKAKTHHRVEQSPNMRRDERTRQVLRIARYDAREMHVSGRELARLSVKMGYPPMPSHLAELTC